MIDVLPLIRRRALLAIVDLLLAVRALAFVGKRYVCPCCGWKLRAFIEGGFSMRTRHSGYCPRCNGKARHRRVWLFLSEETNLFTESLRVFHVSPKYALSRRLSRMANLGYLAADIGRRPNVSLRMDLTAVPIRSSTMDAVICVHVLEHIGDDRAAIGEIYRLLQPGGWALISVPIRLDGPTYEDPSIVSPAAREAAFGETNHVRLYGLDLVDRLEDAGFDVSVDLASAVSETTRQRYGFLDDENIFMCRKTSSEP